MLTSKKLSCLAGFRRHDPIETSLPLKIVFSCLFTKNIIAGLIRIEARKIKIETANKIKNTFFI
jgi:hypothetical protein